eukprot:33952-Eustigmatos_ZCMA.PRE.1
MGPGLRERNKPSQVQCCPAGRSSYSLLLSFCPVSEPRKRLGAYWYYSEHHRSSAHEVDV